MAGKINAIYSVSTVLGLGSLHEQLLFQPERQISQLQLNIVKWGSMQK